MRKRRCVAINKAGRRCRGWAMVGAEPALCGKHGRPWLGPPPDEERCVETRVNGGRCRFPAVKGGLCKRHLRPRRLGPSRKVRCVARRVDGTRCGGWALKELQDVEQPLCAVHAGRSVAQSLPPKGQRCTAMTVVHGKAKGARCRNWAMRETLDGERLCDVHAGVSGFEPGVQMFVWPLPDELRCRGRRRDGERCEGRAVRDGMCPVHAGLTGFKKGNRLAWKHGFCSQPTRVEREAVVVFAAALMHAEEVDRMLLVGLCRVMVRRLLVNMNDPAVHFGYYGVMLRHVKLALEGIGVIRELLAVSHQLSGVSRGLTPDS